VEMLQIRLTFGKEYGQKFGGMFLASHSIMYSIVVAFACT